MSNFISRTKNDMHYLFVKSKTLSKKNKKKKHRAIGFIIGIPLIILQLVTMILFLLQIFKLDILPLKYLIGLNAFLLLILGYNLLSQFTKAHIIGKILSVFLSGIMIFGFLFSSKVISSLNKVNSGISTRTDTVDIVVLNNDPASNIKETISYTYGFSSNINSDIVTKAMNDINVDYSVVLAKKEFSSGDALVNALYENTEIKAIAVMDSMYITLCEQNEDFDEKTKIVGTVAITTETKLSATEKKVNEEPFIVYLSGTDTENGVEGCEGVTLRGRTDVNILAVCNPTTRQMLLISTPRDSYVTISTASGKTGLDKLTHASNSGVEYSIDALKRLYGVTADYFVRINFTGCVNIVNALGGITINSDVEFTNGWEAWYNSYHYNIGPNECDGDRTIAFVRERKAFANGDFQRGKNQEAALQGIIDKATSPAILTNYSAVLDSISDVMLTNMPTSTISALVKGQLNDSRPWNIQSYSIDGTTGTRDCPLSDIYGASVVFPDTDSINCAIQMMSKTTNGEIFDVDEFAEQYMESLSSTASTTKSNNQNILELSE